MSSSGVPFPPSGSFISSVRSSSKAVVDEYDIKISPQHISKFLTLLNADKVRFDKLKDQHGASLPLNFPTPLHELTVTSLLSLLNFASSFRAELHAFAGRGAFDTIRMLVMSMYISSDIDSWESPENWISCKGMARINDAKVAEFMGGLPLMVEKDHESLPGVKVGEKGGRLARLVEMVTGVLNETGQRLGSMGYKALGSFVADLREKSKINGEINNEYMLEHLTKNIPAFYDSYKIPSTKSSSSDLPLYLSKKALFLLHAIAPTSASPPLPIFSDNVIPSLLVSLGIIDLSTCADSGLKNAFTTSDAALLEPELMMIEGAGKKLEVKEGPLLSTIQASILRAAAIEACYQIVQVSGADKLVEGLSEVQVDAFLWSCAKDRNDWRAVPRFRSDSIFY